MIAKEMTNTEARAVCERLLMRTCPRCEGTLIRNAALVPNIFDGRPCLLCGGTGVVPALKERCPCSLPGSHEENICWDCGWAGSRGNAVFVHDPCCGTCDGTDWVSRDWHLEGPDGMLKLVEQAGWYYEGLISRWTFWNERIEVGDPDPIIALAKALLAEEAYHAGK